MDNKRMAGKAIAAFCFLFLILNSLLIQSSAYNREDNSILNMKKNNPVLRSPVRLALGNGNILYTTDYLNKFVAIMIKEGKGFKIIRTIPINGNPLGVAVDQKGQIFVGNSSSNKVEVYGKNLKFKFMLEGEIKRPSDIAVSSNGLIYVVASDENLIKVFQRDGSFKFNFGGDGGGSGEFNFPTGIAVDDKYQEVIVGDFLNKRIQIFDYNGNWLRTIGGGWFSSVIDRPQGIAVDDEGRIYAVDSQQACILVYNRSGDLLKMIGEYGQDRQQLRIPLDVIISRNGDILVTSNQNSRIEVFRESFQ